MRRRKRRRGGEGGGEQQQNHCFKSKVDFFVIILVLKRQCDKVER